jgi:uncharacterized protein (TIGR02118 family)
MIVVSVMYPTTPGAKFDMDYYLGTHMPLVGARCKLFGMTDAKVLRGAGAPGGAAAAYSVIALLTFGSVEQFQSAMEKHGAEILGDIPNYTSIQPVIQISDVLD